jgi:S-adenosylmethionine synthetase
MRLHLERLDCPTTRDQPIEIVERKGIGHPDSICDGIVEHAAGALARAYRAKAGRVAHFNLDKGLLAAGSAERWFGGGRLVEPMRLVFGDRATFSVDGVDVTVDDVVTGAAKDWLRCHLPAVDPERHVLFQSELRPGSPELQWTAEGSPGSAPANDTSAAVGYAPLTPTEELVLATECYLNGREFKIEFPDTGQDVKVMAFRIERDVRLTVAMPFLASHTTSENQYFRRKAEASAALLAHLDRLPFRPPALDLELNTLDVPGRDAGGTYLTLLGTSAEDGDSGEVGRGNRVNGLISLNRPASVEAAAGKNPVSHVGKLYNVLSFQLAHAIHRHVAGVREVSVWLGSQIGTPVDEPPVVAVQVILAPGARLERVRREATRIVEEGLAGLGGLTNSLIDGTIRIY